jgi:hypothetical protein
MARMTVMGRQPHGKPSDLKGMGRLSSWFSRDQLIALVEWDENGGDGIAIAGNWKLGGRAK